MNIRSVAVITVALAACRPGVPELETRTFRLESLRPDQALEIVAPYVYVDREDTPGTMTVTDGALTVRETGDNIERIARVLEEFDRPMEAMRLRFQVVEANGAGGADPDIAAVEEELRRLFRFEGYRLVGEGLVTVADGAGFDQRLTGESGSWSVSGRVYRVGQGAVRLDGVRLLGTEPLFETSVSVRPGQTLVLGSAQAPGEEGAVILIVQAERAG